MLVLTRRTGEVLIIGDNVNVTVLSIVGNQVKLGIDAPRDVPVNREEIYYRIQEVEHQVKDPVDDQKGSL